MKGARAVVTGATSGLGLEFSREWVRSGAELIAIGRNETTLKKLAEEVPTGRNRVRYVVADLACPEENTDLIKRCYEAFGDSRPIDHLIYSAGVGTTGLIEEIPGEAFLQAWNVNFFSAVSLVQQILPHMKREKRGVITLVSSGVALRALPFNSPYCAAKASLQNFSESLRVEANPFGIKVVLFSPGPVDSNFESATKHYGQYQIKKPSTNGRAAHEVGQWLFDAVVEQRERYFIGGKASLAYHLNYWSPKLLDRILTKLFKADRQS